MQLIGVKVAARVFRRDVVAMRFTLSSNLRIVNLEEQSVIMDVKQGKYFACNRTGALIINSLRMRCELGEIIKSVQDRFGQPSDQIRNDVSSFLQQLVQNLLCHVSD